MSARPNTGRPAPRSSLSDAPSPEQRAGLRVREIRMQMNISQDSLARQMQALGYSWRQTTVGKTEAAQRPLRLNELADLANILGVTLTDLLGIDQDAERAAVTGKILGARAALASLDARQWEVSREIESLKERFKADAW